MCQLPHEPILWGHLIMIFWQEVILFLSKLLRSHETHIASFHVHSACAPLARPWAVEFWFCNKGKSTICFKSKYPSAGFELELSNFCSGLAQAQVSCVVCSSISWIRDVLSRNVKPPWACQAPLQDLLLWLQYKAPSCFWLEILHLWLSGHRKG